MPQRSDSRNENIRVDVYWEVRNPDGSLVEKGYRKNDFALRNLANYLAIVLLHLSRTLVDIFGTSYTVSPASGYYRTGSSSVMRIRIGSGTTPPTKVDYKLESQLALINASEEVVEEDENNRYRFTCRVTWTPSSAVTVSEVGLSKSVFIVNELRNYEILMFRTLIGPVELQAYQSITIWFHIYIPYGT